MHIMVTQRWVDDRVREGFSEEFTLFLDDIKHNLLAKVLLFVKRVHDIISEKCSEQIHFGAGGRGFEPLCCEVSLLG